jgi:isoleucyl-tRNA synthetase
LEYTFGEEDFKVLKEFKGSELKGIGYEPVFDFFVSEKSKNDFKIYLYEGVTLEEGTGILHVAPAFGAEDHELGLKHGISGIVGSKLGNFTSGGNNSSGFTAPSGGNALRRYLDSFNVGVSRDVVMTRVGFSVRCFRDI